MSLVAAAGCGGSSTSDSAGGAAGAGTGGSAGTGGTGGSVGGSSGSAGTGGSSAAAGIGGSTGGSGGGVSCETLLADVQAKLIEAKKCCLPCASVQCTGSVPGVCCEETVSASDSPETQDYLAALKAFQGAGCVVPCPEIVCANTPSYQCGQSASGEAICM